MQRHILVIVGLSLVVLLLLLKLGGCGDSSSQRVASENSASMSGQARSDSPEGEEATDAGEQPETPADYARRTGEYAPSSANTIGEHAHKTGDNGGVIVPVGRDHYHAEAVFTADGSLKLFMLGQDEQMVIDVVHQDLTAYIRAPGDIHSTDVTLEPMPQLGDAEGRTSLFVGRMPAEFIGRPLIIVVPLITISEKRYRFSFVTPEATPGTRMPTKVTNEAERELYLTPGGQYTADDIRANGSKTASQRYAGFQSAHDMNPQRGQKICPITQTKANPKCTWTVGGQVYQFCCPPCIDEFVKLAKTKPDEVKPAKDYVKQ